MTTEKKVQVGNHVPDDGARRVARVAKQAWEAKMSTAGKPRVSAKTQAQDAKNVTRDARDAQANQTPFPPNAGAPVKTKRQEDPGRSSLHQRKDQHDL